MSPRGLTLGKSHVGLSICVVGIMIIIMENMGLLWC